MIETNFGKGTAFSIDVDNREYWLTAKHVFTGIESGPAGEFSTRSVQANILSQAGEGDVGHDLHWITTKFTTIDPGKDIDILVLVPDEPKLAGGPYTINSGDVNVGIGADCEFLGFPYGGGWKAAFSSTPDAKSTRSVWLPYVKRCTVSGQVREKGLLIWILDGINNHGFSGGPVLYGTGTSQKVFAVISGYHEEPLEVIADASNRSQTNFVPPPPVLPGEQPSQPNKQIVNVNSGFILAFDLEPAIKAIKANPIGPLLPNASSAGSQSGKQQR